MSVRSAGCEKVPMSSEGQPFRFSVRSPDFVKDPYSFYRILRETDPVHFSSDGYWFITRYSDVATCLRDPRLGNAPAPFSLLNRRNADKFVAAAVANRLIAFLDAPQHTMPRRVISTTFQESILGEEKYQKIEDACSGCLARIAGKKEIDFVTDFAVPFSVRCISDLFGIDSSLADKMPYWADAIFRLFHSFPNREVFVEVNEGVGEFRKFMSSLMKDRISHPRQDIATRLIQAGQKNQTIVVEQIVDNAMLICADAIGYVHNGLTNAVFVLLTNEEQRNRLKGDPTLTSQAVDECLRFESPSQYQGRIAAEDIEIEGKVIKRNSVVLLALGSANRDPRVFTEPDKFDIFRPKATHLAFGLGPHRCIGIGLVRSAFECALRQLFQGDIKLNLADREIRWVSRAGHRWPESLRLGIDR